MCSTEELKSCRYGTIILLIEISDNMFLILLQQWRKEPSWKESNLIIKRLFNYIIIQIRVNLNCVLVSMCNTELFCNISRISRTAAVKMSLELVAHLFWFKLYIMFSELLVGGLRTQHGFSSVTQHENINKGLIKNK